MFAEFGRECVDPDVATSSHLMSSLPLCSCFLPPPRLTLCYQNCQHDSKGLETFQCGQKPSQPVVNCQGFY